MRVGDRRDNKRKTERDTKRKKRERDIRQECMHTHTNTQKHT